MVRVNEDGTTKLFMANTPGVGAIPGGFMEDSERGPALDAMPPMLPPNSTVSGTAAAPKPPPKPPLKPDGPKPSEEDSGRNETSARSTDASRTEASEDRSASEDDDSSEVKQLLIEKEANSAELRKTTTGAIVGIAVAAMVAIAIVAVLAIYLLKQRKKPQNSSDLPLHKHDGVNPAYPPMPHAHASLAPFTAPPPISRQIQDLSSSRGSGTISLPPSTGMHGAHADSAIQRLDPLSERPPMTHPYVMQAPQSEQITGNPQKPPYPPYAYGYPGSVVNPPQAIGPRSLQVPMHVPASMGSMHGTPASMGAVVGPGGSSHGSPPSVGKVTYPSPDVAQSMHARFGSPMTLQAESMQESGASGNTGNGVSRNTEVCNHLLNLP